MKEFIEKLIGRLEESTVMMASSKEFWNNPQNGNYVREVIPKETAIEIANELAEEYKGGWISVDDRLPDIEHISGVSETVLVTTNDNSIFTAEYHGNGKWLDDVADWILEVIAWQPLPTPYKEGCE